MTPALASYFWSLGSPSGFRRFLAPGQPERSCSFGAEHLWVNQPFWVSLFAMPHDDPGLTLYSRVTCSHHAESQWAGVGTFCGPVASWLASLAQPRLFWRAG